MQTKYFGELECPEEELIRFPRGLFGFEEERSFFLLPFQGSGGSLLCFQGDYAPVLPPEELRRMGVEKSEELCFYTLCVVRSPVADSTVNLRCPVAVNDRTRRAMQVILEGEDYHMHHLLSEFAPQRGDGPC